jgi:DNA-binding transcriptional LysR family regulator
MIGVRVTDELPFVVAGSPAYFKQRGKPKTPDDLVRHNCVRIRFSSGTYVPWRFRVKRRDLEVHVQGRLSVNSVAVGRQAAIEGLALVQTPPIFIAGDLAARRLVTVLDDGRQLRRRDFFFIIRAVAKCGRRSRPWWIFCARSAVARPRKPRNDPTRGRNWGRITCPRAGCSLLA